MTQYIMFKTPTVFFIACFILLNIAACDDASSSDSVSTDQEQGTETATGDTGTGTDTDVDTGSESATVTEEDSATDTVSETATFRCGPTLTCGVSSQYCEQASGGVDDGSGPDYSCHALPSACRDNLSCQCLEINIDNGAMGCMGDGETGLTSSIAYP